MAKTICTQCDFRGEAHEAFRHYYLTRHTMTYKGVVQEFDMAVREQDAILAAKRGREQKKVSAA